MSRDNTNTIYLVRHGENPANITHEFSYKYVDYSLTAKGQLQARQTADYFKDKHIHEVYSSPLKRARETAEIIAQRLELEVTVLEYFREVNIGLLEGQPPTEENWRFHDRIAQDWFEGKHESTFPGGENYTTLLARMKAGLLTVTHHKTGKNIVIVGHGGIFTRTMKDICPTLDTEVLLRVENANCSISRIELTTNGEQVVGTLQEWASHGHLYGEAANLVPGTLLQSSTPAHELP